MTVPLLKATLIPIERRPGEQGEVTFSDPFIWSLVTFEDTKRKEDAVMVFSRGDLLVDLHGLMLGVLFLLGEMGALNFDWIWRFWPLILIAIGVRILMQRQKRGW